MGFVVQKTVCIHQPDFMPWLGFFHRLIHSDLFVILDDVQLLRQGWHHRDKIKTSRGAQWLTVPIKWKGRTIQKIKDAEIDNTLNWRKKHLKTLQHSYRAAKYFHEIFPEIENIYAHQPKFLIDLNIRLLSLFLEKFNINIPIVFSSSMSISQKSTELIISILKRVYADKYISGLGAKDYLDEGQFEQAGIDLVWQSFEHPVYPQLHGEFVPMLSAIDFLFNSGGQDLFSLLS